MSGLHRTKMAKYQPSEDHLCHYMLFHFRSGFNATVATKKICEVYRYILQWVAKLIGTPLKIQNFAVIGRKVI